MNGVETISNVEEASKFLQSKGQNFKTIVQPGKDGIGKFIKADPNTPLTGKMKAMVAAENGKRFAKKLAPWALGGAVLGGLALNSLTKKNNN